MSALFAGLFGPLIGGGVFLVSVVMASAAIGRLIVRPTRPETAEEKVRRLVNDAAEEEDLYGAVHPLFLHELGKMRRAAVDVNVDWKDFLSYGRLIRWLEVIDRIRLFRFMVAAFDEGRHKDAYDACTRLLARLRQPPAIPSDQAEALTDHCLTATVLMKRALLAECSHPDRKRAAEAAIEDATGAILLIPLVAKDHPQRTSLFNAYVIRAQAYVTLGSVRNAQADLQTAEQVKLPIATR